MLTDGKVIKNMDGLYEVMTDSGERISCQARGVFRKDKTVVTVGDMVTVKDGAIYDIKARKNIIIRPPLANLDILFIVMAAAAPEPVLLTADKLTCIAVHNSIKPAIIITKCDLNTEKADIISGIYSKAGIKTFLTSSAAESGLDELNSYLKEEASDKTSAFAGASGVGKSTLMNALFPNLNIQTGEISRRISRGRHTTRHTELFPLSELLNNKEYSGYLADTAGFSMLDFTRFNFFMKEDLPFNFPEFEPYLAKCRYTKCTHTKEEGCVIIEAVSSGIIAKERHESYVELYNELKNKHEWD